ncbi:hypothetical protein R6242_12230 [Iodobacter sp. CM08]|uniref:hypothetical protein n=1 Tax=Iodobacter sp. CM08 TaxID=3085902 RepID=UPI002980FA00|nr:hypothetical protein [Iodobacter sp. CM08]MDW5417335.1 hypothetical protein [Iodobacter sp. CM08]
MKIFSACFPSINSRKENEKEISVDALDKKIHSAIIKNHCISKSACHHTAIEIALFDGKIGKETKSELYKSLENNYSQRYRDIMEIGENNTNSSLVVDQKQSGFLNFIKQDGVLCHTAYLKASDNGSVEYYHTNSMTIDKEILDECGSNSMSLVSGSGITHYEMNHNSISAINRVISSNNWSVSFTPASSLADLN